MTKRGTKRGAERGTKQGTKGGRPRRGGGPKKKSGASNRYLVPGERAVRELLEGRPQAVKQLWVESGREFEWLDEVVGRLGVSVQVTERQALDAMVGVGLARGIVAHATPPVLHPLDVLLDAPAVAGARRQVLVALDEVVDPGNLGAILRSAEFFGVQGVFWGRDRSAPLSPLAVRASAGATERLLLGQVTNLARALRDAKEAGWWTVGTLPATGRALGRLAQELPERVVVVMGGEGRGLRKLTIANCDFHARIEGVGELASLNVSAAAAVVLSQLAGAKSDEGAAESD